MERGLLTGKYFNESKLKENDHRKEYFSQFNLEKVKNLITSLEPIAENKKVSVAQLVLRWTTIQPAITVVLAGSRNAEQSIANAKAMDINLSSEELMIINNQLSKL